MFSITHDERAAWQLRATTVLAAIVRAHHELPILSWIVGSTGATLGGHVIIAGRGGNPAAIRQAFHAWRRALDLTEHTWPAGGDNVTTLRAGGEVDRVRVHLTAPLRNHDDHDHGDDHGDGDGDGLARPGYPPRPSLTGTTWPEEGAS